MTKSDNQCRKRPQFTFATPISTRIISSSTPSDGNTADAAQTGERWRPRSAVTASCSLYRDDQTADRRYCRRSADNLSRIMLLPEECRCFSRSTALAARGNHVNASSRGAVGRPRFDASGALLSSDMPRSAAQLDQYTGRWIIVTRRRRSARWLYRQGDQRRFPAGASPAQSRLRDDSPIYINVCDASYQAENNPTTQVTLISTSRVAIASDYLYRVQSQRATASGLHLDQRPAYPSRRR